MELRKNSEKLILEQIKAGIKIAEIKKNFKIGKIRITNIFKMHTSSSVGVCFGHKNAPYYDCEDYTMAEYSYDDLSLIEKEFYESRSN